MAHAQAARLIVWLEGLYAIGWIILMAFGQAKGDVTFRTAIFFLLFHFVFSTVPMSWGSYKYNKKKHPHDGYPAGYLFVFVFAIAVDINNLLESILHLPRNVSLWYGMIVMSSVAIAISTLSVLWYASVLYKHSPDKGKIVVWRGKLPRFFADPNPYKE